MSYIETLQQLTNKAYTENGAIAFKSTLDANLDFFARAGAMRGQSDEAVGLFLKAFNENPHLAIRSLFYMRDIRGGQGERDLFRKCLPKLPISVLSQIAEHIPTYGRWDDLLSLPTKIIAPIIREQLDKDDYLMASGKPISLLAKWMPSENTSSKNTKLSANKLIAALNTKPSRYRKRLSRLRSYLQVLEQKMSARHWDEIDYATLPSQAHRKHTGAFIRNNKTRYEEYLESVKRGEKEIKTSTLYTYEVYEDLKKNPEVASVMWNNLPDYTNGNNALVVADVSGSMSGRPMSVSVSLALYFAERNQGPFRDYFMTFSANPQMQHIVGETLADKVRFIERSDWDMNTDLGAVFETLLNAAIQGEARQEELPSTLYIISDMEFDACISVKKDLFTMATDLFKEHGYKLPHVVFWNVNSRTEQVPATKFNKHVTLISGSSQSSFRYAVENKTPVEFMNEVLNSERYSPIVIEI